MREKKKERLIYARGIGDHIMFQRFCGDFICNCGAVFVLVSVPAYMILYIC